MTRVVIVGAGVTGLTAAYRLLGKADITVLEASNRVGGSLVTVRRDGLVLDGGADAFVTTKPNAIQLCKDLGLGDRLVETIPENRRVYFLKGERLVSLPEGLVLAVPTRFWPFVTSPLFSARGVARMGLDLVIPKRRDGADESIAGFLGRRFGQEAIEILGEPLLAGIYSGDPGRLSIASTFPQLVALEKEHGGLIAGALAMRAKRPRRTSGPPPSPFMALCAGMGELVEALHEKVRPQIRTSSTVTRIDREGAAYRVSIGHDEIVADRVLLACPAPASARALDALAPEAARELRSIPHVSTASLLFAFDRAAIPHAMDASGILIPRREGHDASAITFMTSKWAGRAPDDVAVLRVFLGGHARPEVRTMTDADLVHVARGELASVLGIRAEPRSVDVFRWNDCRPQPVLGHTDRVRRIRDHLAACPGVLVAGAAFDGVGIPDCVRQAEQAADALAK